MREDAIESTVCALARNGREQLRTKKGPLQLQLITWAGFPFIPSALLLKVRLI